MNKLSLNSVEWKEFRLSDIFIIKDGYYNKKPPADTNGNIPFLGATKYNNGITEFYTINTVKKWDKVGKTSIVDISKKIFNGNCLAIVNNGSIGNIYYQKSNFTCSHDVTPVYLKGVKLNKYLAMFLISCLQKTSNSYEYGKKWRPKRMISSKLLLPIDEKGEPNWVFMENYIMQIMNRQKSQIISYCKSQLSDIAYGGRDLQNSDIEWKGFIIGDIFNIFATSSGIDKNKLKLGDGNMPYITRSDLNNGISLFIPYKQDNKYKIDCGNVITIGLDTQTAFYQNYDFYTGQNIQIVKHKKFNKYNALFLIPLIKKQMQKFNWGGNGATLTRLKRTKILLPIDEKGEPNWKYMENYVKQKLHSQAKQIINYYES